MESVVVASCSFVRPRCTAGGGSLRRYFFGVTHLWAGPPACSVAALLVALARDILVHFANRQTVQHRPYDCISLTLVTAGCLGAQLRSPNRLATN